MRLKKILAGIMAIVFSLNLIQINVNAEATSEETKEQNVVVSKEEKTSENNTTKEIAVKIVENSVKGISTVARLTFSGIKSLLKLAGVGIKYVAMGACLTVGAIIVIKSPKYIPRIIYTVKQKLKLKSNVIKETWH